LKSHKHSLLQQELRQTGKAP